MLPASNDPVPTRVLTDQGWLDFQHWFVGLRAQPPVTRVEFTVRRRPAPCPTPSRRSCTARAVVIAPSNPFISIDPILAIPGFRRALQETAAPVIAVSPIIGGRAVKGPTAKMMADRGTPPSARAVADHYGDLIDIFVADLVDADSLAGLSVCFVVLAPGLMTTLADKEALARAVLGAA